MRNLLGRLNARSTEDLGQIADAWQTPLTSRDRLAQISQLYRTMTRPPMVRAQWDALDEDVKAVLNVLVEAGDAGSLLDKIASTLDQPLAATREAVVTLYDSGMLAYEGTAATLPIGESPILFVPIELASTIRKIAGEVELGDISATPFPDLIQTKSERELFDAADHWGIEVIPGVTTRAQLVANLSRAVANGSIRGTLIDKLGHEIRLLWEKLQAAPFGTPLAVDGLIGAGSDRTVFSRRNAINELEDRLIVWPTVIDGRTRALFVPLEVGSGLADGAQVLPRPKPVSVIGSDEAPYRPKAPLAWDLMVVLQRLFGPLAPPGVDPLALPRTTASELNRMLWNRGSETLPLSYLEMLIEFATQLGLLAEPDDTSGQFERTAAVREWRLSPWATQRTRIRSVWMNSPTWVEGQNRQDIEPWNVDWQAYRVKLLHHLASLETGKWYRANDIAEWMASYDPGILGAGATVAVNRGGGEADGTERQRSIAVMISHTISTVLDWMGLIRCHRPSRDELLICVSEELRRVTRAEAGDHGATDASRPVLSVGDDLSVHVTDPEPIQVWSLLAFAETLTLARESVFVITSESVRNALGAGFRPEHIVQFLQKPPAPVLPADLLERITGLGERADGFDISTALVIDTGSAESADGARAVLENDGYITTQVGKRLYVSVGTQRPVSVDTERVHARLLATGLGKVTNRTRS